MVISFVFKYMFFSKYKSFLSVNNIILEKRMHNQPGCILLSRTKSEDDEDLIIISATVSFKRV